MELFVLEVFRKDFTSLFKLEIFIYGLSIEVVKIFIYISRLSGSCSIGCINPVVIFSNFKYCSYVLGKSYNINPSKLSLIIFSNSSFKLFKLFPFFLGLSFAFLLSLLL